MIEVSCPSCGVIADVERIPPHKSSTTDGKQQMDFACPCCGGLLARTLDDKMIDLAPNAKERRRPADEKKAAKKAKT